MAKRSIGDPRIRLSQPVSEQQKASDGSRVLKDDSDPTKSWQTISYLQNIWQSLQLDIDCYKAAWEEAEQLRPWERVPYDEPYGTKEEMLRRLDLGDVGAMYEQIQGLSHMSRRLDPEAYIVRKDSENFFDTLAAVAKVAGVTPATVSRWIRDRRLQAVVVPNPKGVGRPCYRIEREDLEELRAKAK